MSQSPRRSAYRLTQLGTIAARQFGERVSVLGLSRSDAGILHLIALNPAISQRMLAQRLGAPPSRVVEFIDSLETRQLVSRVRSARDRRNYELNLTDEGQQTLGQLRRISEEHEEAVLASLSPAERTQLGRLLEKLAAAHQLDPDVHPGYARPVGQEK